MITNLHQPLEQFFKQFDKHAIYRELNNDGSTYPFIPLTNYSGDEFLALLRYYSRSGESSVEDLHEYYPCIIIQDFQPTLDSSRISGVDWIDGFYDPINNKTIKEYLPIPFKFKFQVSCVTRRKNHDMAMQDWFLKNFIGATNNFFIFNEVKVGDSDFIGDVVQYKISQNELTRDDGRFELVYDFEFSTFIYSRAKSYIFVSDDEGYAGENFSDAMRMVKVNLLGRQYDSVENIINNTFDLYGRTKG